MSPGDIPSVSFRLPTSFGVKPELICDRGPAGGVIVGQNAAGADFDAILLGKLAERPYKEVWLDVRGAHVVYIMGKRRSGKTYTLGALAEGIVTDAWVRQGGSPQGLLVLDTMNVFLTLPLANRATFAKSEAPARELDVWKLEGGAVPTSLFHPQGTSVPSEVASTGISLRPSDLSSEEWCGLFDIDPFADPMGHLMTDLYERVVSGYVDAESDQLVPARQAFALADLIDALDNDSHFDRFPDDTREALRRRLSAVRRLPIFSENGLDLRDLIQPGRVSVLLLRDLDHDMRSVLVALVTRKVMQLRGKAEQYERMEDVHRARARKYSAEGDDTAAGRELALAEASREQGSAGLPRCWLVIDEAHNYIPSRGRNPARQPLKKYVDEGRNLGLSIVVATQQPSGLDPSIQRNADVLLLHALSHRDDIVAADGMINTALPEEVVIDSKTKATPPRILEALLRQLPQGYAWISTDRANRLIPVKIRPRLTVHGGTDY